MKALITSTSLRRMMTGLAFSMAFLLTPRAWVEVERQGHSASIPVQMLERQGTDCLWCTPQEVTPCDEASQPSTPERLRLNPDELPQPHQTTPCQDVSKEEARPSA